MYRDIRNLSRQTEERRVRITESSPRNRWVRGSDDAGNNITISLDLQPSVVDIPQTGDTWIAQRKGISEWKLDRRLETNPAYAIEDLVPGDKRIEAASRLILHGDQIILSTDTSSDTPAIIVNGVALQDILDTLQQHADWIDFLYNNTPQALASATQNPDAAPKNQQTGYYGRNHVGLGPPFRIGHEQPEPLPPNDSSPPDRSSDGSIIAQGPPNSLHTFNAVSFVMNLPTSSA